MVTSVNKDGSISRAKPNRDTWLCDAYTFALPDKRRPVLILSRDSVLPRLNEIIVVPTTRTIRGIDTEVGPTENDGMPTACALNFDHVSLVRKERLGATIARFDEGGWPEIERALLVACGFAPST